MPFYNFCKWQASTIGTGSFGVGAAAPADDISAHDVPENCDVVDGGIYRYYARTADGSQSEWGHGTYSTSSHALARTTVLSNSDQTTSPVNFTTAPIVDVFPPPQKSASSAVIPSGTNMLFQQSTAPLGWTKQTTHNDKTLRVVSGTAGSGGSLAFSTVFARTQTDGHSLSIGEMPLHSFGPTSGEAGFLAKNLASSNNTSPYCIPINDATSAPVDLISTTATIGSGTAHVHPADMRVQYVDLIIATKA